jgi:hypothetical protein
MQFGETVVVYYENHLEHADTLWAVLTSQETHNVSATEPNRLMLFGETVAVYRENHAEHTDTLWAVRTSSQETYYVSTTDTNRLMQLGKQSLFTVRATRNTDTLCGPSVPHHRKHITSPLQRPTG